MEQIEINDFEERIGIHNNNSPYYNLGVKLVVGLQDLWCIQNIHIMTNAYLRTLLSSVTLRDQPSVHPYQNCEFNIVRLDPRASLVGQVFLERQKWINLLEGFEEKLAGFSVSGGIAKLAPFVAIGKTKEGTIAIANYLPPLVEFYGNNVLLDGTHRSYIVKRTGTTIDVILISSVTVPLPFVPVAWEEVSPVDKKPAQDVKYREFQPEFFRDLHRSGIDG